MKGKCILCGDIVNITASPNQNEYYFISKMDLEEIELKFGDDKFDDIRYRDFPEKLRYTVICDGCIERIISNLKT